MIELAKGQFKVFGGEDISAIPVHELDGSFNEISGLEFDQSLEEWLLCLLEALLDSLVLHDMMYEIGVGK